MDEEPTGVLHHEEDRVVDETDSEDESAAEVTAHSSPTLVRSAFVANSALPVSPVVRSMASSSDARREVSATPHISESDVDLTDYDTRSMSSAALQLQQEYESSEHTIPESQPDSVTNPHHRHKRRRNVSESPTSDPPDFKAPTGSVFEPEGPYTQQLLFRESSLPDVESDSEPERPQPQDLLFRNQSSIPEFESEPLNGDTTPHQPPSRSQHPDDQLDNEETIHIQPSHCTLDSNPSTGTHTHDPNDDDDAEEYAVESIIEHFYEGGKKYYLVKWEGYEDSHDWLPEEDLAGAADIVAEYNRRFGRRKGKKKAR